jgi:hypothetical protein
MLNILGWLAKLYYLILEERLLLSFTILKMELMLVIEVK